MRRLLLLTAVILAASDRPGSAEDNLLANPGFEQGDAAPQPWSFNRRNTESRIVWQKERANAGEASVSIANATEAESGNVVQTLRLEPPLEPGSRVVFSAYAACDDLRQGEPRIIITLHSPSGSSRHASASGVGGAHEFAEIRGDVVTDTKTDRIAVYLCNYGVGTVWWDDASLTVDRAAPTRIVPRTKDSQPLPPLTTGDGLALVLTDSGSVEALSLDDRTQPKPSYHSGLWLRPFRGDSIAVAGAVTHDGTSIRQVFHDVANGLRVEAVFLAEADRITCTGSVEDTSGNDRGVELFFALPVGAKDWRWGKSIREESVLAGRPHSVDDMTFSSLSDPSTGAGIALAVPADSPCDCSFGYDEQFGYRIGFRFGLSQAGGGNLKGRAPLKFVIYRCDGAWGLRDAARRYYAFWPKAFEKRVRREGLWMFGNPRFPLPDPENYAFHEGGPNGWEFDEKHGIETCPYIIPGQRELTRLDSLPADAGEAMRVFQQFKETPSAVNARGRRKDWGANMLEIIENCMLFNAEGRPHVWIRNTPWGGNSITFPLNASPYLYRDSDRSTVAKSLLAAVAEQHDATPALDGTYVDSLGAWGNYFNFRQEHFSSAQIPFSYDPATGKPVTANRFSLLEFLEQLGRQLHQRGRLLFANGLHPNRRFHFFALDVLGVEGHGQMEQKRVMAYQKPFLLLIYNILDQPARMEQFFHLATFYGIYPSFANMADYKTPESYAPVAALNRRFVPALQKITAAGWEPVSYARASHPDLWIERWGSGAGAYLTVHNASDRRRNETLVLDTGRLGLLGAGLTAEDLLSDESWTAHLEGNTATVHLEVPSRETRVLRLGGR